jgi:hypothetical protein
MNLAVIWRGAFIDASKHWNSRGGGAQPPLGYDVVKPTGEVTPAFFVADKPDAQWPKWEKDIRYDGFGWKGYSLDAKRNPTFRYTWHDATVEESYEAIVDRDESAPVRIAPRLERTVKVSGTLPANAWFRIASGGPFDMQGGMYFCKDGNSKVVVSADGALVAGQNLVVPAKPGTMTIRYQWPN